MIVEYCHYGNLRQQLLRKRDDFIDTMDDDCKWNAASKKKEALARGTAGLDYINVFHGNDASDSGASNHLNDDTVPLTTKDLVCYAFQVARGMEFLSSRKVGGVAFGNELLYGQGNFWFHWTSR